MRAIEYAKTLPFMVEAKVRGFLLQADIGPICYGYVYGCAIYPEGTFIRFAANGTDDQQGFNLVRSIYGGAFVIISFASHALEAGLSRLERFGRTCRHRHENTRGEQGLLI